MSPRNKRPRRRKAPTPAPVSSPAPATVAWWKRPVTWLLTIVVGAVATWLGAVVLGMINQWKPADELAEELAGRGPLVVLDVKHVPYPQEGSLDYVYPAGSDLARLDAARPDDPAVEAGAVDIERSTWEITLVGTRDEAAEAVDLRPVLVEPCRAPLTGIKEPNESQGESKKVVLVTHVDRPNPRMLVEDRGGDEAGAPFFATHKITLPKGEKNVIQVRALSAKQHCRWRLELDYLADGRRQTMVISAPGDKPFEVTGRADDSAYTWVYLNPINGCRAKDGSKTDRLRITGAEYAQMVREGRNCPYW
ncbi:hypothetical protein JNW91_03645 [Micromonospora sp. STR1_7]|uniref:Uncharacterized protein n=1 Tax=Micromonospora parastrephiae TaxID=2806101 RepID=A0ABS1XP81_9ACTN|nr:hypothetical protein [Micromonospora parastrephiae]MBM0231049.1 hypothetical protein [Micromonospora parastrephiae]